ncbi:amine-terminal domain guanylate-binding protein, putative, partial (macronuclear) [Tetrahymena thermophila SB210]
MYAETQERYKEKDSQVNQCTNTIIQLQSEVKVLNDQLKQTEDKLKETNQAYQIEISSLKLGTEKNQLQRIQEYNFEDVLLANIGVDTSDLCQKQSFGTDTCDLVEKQDKCINVNIQKQMKYQSTQTVCTTESKAQQVNIRTIINENK